MALGPTGNRTVQVVVGATLAADFRRTFGSASDQAKRFGATVKALDVQARQIAGLERQQQAVNQARLAWGRAEAEVKRLATSMSNVAQPTARQAAALARAEAAADKAAAKVKALNDTLAAAPPPNPRQVQNLARIREQAGAAAERVRALEAALARGGQWGAGAAKLRGELEKAREKAAALEAKARDLAAAMGAARAPTQAQAAALNRARQAAEQATAKVEKLRQAIASTAGPSREQAAAFDRARETARRAKDAFEAQSAALERTRRAARDAGINLRDLSGEANRIGTAYRHATTAMERFNTVAERRRALGDAARDMAVAGATAWGFSRPLGTAINAFADLQHGLARFGTVTGATNSELATLRDRLNGLSSIGETNQPATALLGGIAELTGKGMERADAIASIREIGRVATATGATIEDVAGAAFSSWQNLGIKPEELARSFDIMAQSAADGGFELRHMARNFPAITGLAQVWGMTGQRGIASISAMMQVALKNAASPDVAANNMRNLFSAMGREETIKNFRDMGVDLEAAMRDAMARGINPVERLVGLTRHLTGGDPFKIGRLFTDQQARDAIIALTQNTEDYIRIRDRAFRARGVNDENYGRMVDSLTEKTKALRGAWSSFAESVGRAIRPFWEPVVVGLTRLGETLTSFSERFPILVGGAVTAATALLALGVTAKAVALAWAGIRLGAAFLGAARVIAPLARVLPAIGAALPWITAGFSAMGAAIVAHPVVAVVAGLAAGALLIAQNWSRISPIFTRIGEVIGNVVNIFRIWGRTLTGVVGGAFRGLANLIPGALGLAMRSVVRVLDFDPMERLRPVWEPVAGFFASVGQGIRDGLAAPFAWIGEQIDWLQAKLVGFMDAISGALSAARQAWDRLVGATPTVPMPERGAPSAADPTGQGLLARRRAANQGAGGVANGARPIEPELWGSGMEPGPARRAANDLPPEPRVAPPAATVQPPAPAAVAPAAPAIPGAGSSASPSSSGRGDRPALSGQGGARLRQPQPVMVPEGQWRGAAPGSIPPATPSLRSGQVAPAGPSPLAASPVDALGGAASRATVALNGLADAVASPAIGQSDTAPIQPRVSLDVTLPRQPEAPAPSVILPPRPSAPPAPLVPDVEVGGSVVNVAPPPVLGGAAAAPQGVVSPGAVVIPGTTMMAEPPPPPAGRPAPVPMRLPAMAPLALPSVPGRLSASVEPGPAAGDRDEARLRVASSAPAAVSAAGGVQIPGTSFIAEPPASPAAPERGRVETGRTVVNFGRPATATGGGAIGGMDWRGRPMAAGVGGGATILPFPSVGGAPGGMAGAMGADMPQGPGAVAGTAAPRRGEDIATSERAQAAMKFFEERGWSRAQAAGIVGNLIAESNLRTDAVGDGGRARGVAQWHPDRQAEFRRVTGKDLSQASLDEHLGFVHHEMTAGRERRAGDILRGTRTSAEAAAVVDRHYERSAGLHRGQRIAHAARLESVANQRGPAARPPVVMAMGATPEPLNWASMPVGAAVAGEQGGAAPVLGSTQAGDNANDNDTGGTGAARAAGENPGARLPIYAGGGGGAAMASGGGSVALGGGGAQVGTINAPVTVNITAPAGMDAQQVAILARQEVERAQRRHLDTIRRGLYD